jgi:hypothetical protein
MKRHTVRFLVLASVIFGFASSLQADVLIYNLTLTNRLIGGGTNMVVIARGKLLREIDTGENTLLYRYSLSGGRNFYELHCASFSASQVVLPGGTNTVLAGIRRLRSPVDTNVFAGIGMFYARGANQSIELRPFRTESVASVLRGTAREVVNSDDGNTYVVESASTATLNTSLTRDANTRGKSLSQIIFEQQQTWQDAGFRLVADDCFDTVP